MVSSLQQTSLIVVQVKVRRRKMPTGLSRLMLSRLLSLRPPPSTP
jgi:hypothetical protein